VRREVSQEGKSEATIKIENLDEDLEELIRGEKKGVPPDKRKGVR